MSGHEVVNGYTDLHCHGGAGYYFSDPNPENILKAVQFHKSHGTSQLIASLVTESIPDLRQQILRLIPFCEDGTLAGIHLEGPYLAKSRCGAHNPELLKAPELEEIKMLLDISRGFIKIITIAPELDNAIAIISYLSKSKVIAAIGHSAGSYDDALRAIEAGAGLVTHFSNGMSKLSDGDRTFATAILYQSHIPFEIILDGHHVNSIDTKTIFEVAAPRAVLITDAMSATGMPDGDYQIGSLKVIVKDSTARLENGLSLAGSTLTMQKAVSNALELGISNQIVENAAKLLPSALLRGVS
ncbi:MAG: hypothetical protein RL771_920 [Actinomycetota bacterium]